MPIPLEFFGDFPLHKSVAFHVDLQGQLEAELPTFVAFCPRCQANHTFRTHEVLSDASTGDQKRAPGAVVGVRSKCAGCQKQTRQYLIRFHESKRTIEKVGQFPPPSIEIRPELEKTLGEYRQRFRNGLICENHGFGIGAFAYYRRIVEGLIDGLLEEIGELIPEGERDRYREALAMAKKTQVTREKIDLVKELLPTNLRTGDLNPLAALHSALSDGLHAREEEECLNLAEQVRSILEYLVSEVSVTKRSRIEYTASMRELLEKRKQWLASKAPPALE